MARVRLGRYVPTFITNSIIFIFKEYMYLYAYRKKNTT